MHFYRNWCPFGHSDFDIDDLDRLVTKANQLVQLFKPKQNTSSAVLVHPINVIFLVRVLSVTKLEQCIQTLALWQLDLGHSPSS